MRWVFAFTGATARDWLAGLMVDTLGVVAGETRGNLQYTHDCGLILLTCHDCFVGNRLFFKLLVKSKE